MALIAPPPATAAPTPSVAVSKTADATVLAGGRIEYTLTIANPNTGGAVSLYNASFSDTLPLGVCYVAGSAAPYPDPAKVFDPATNRQVLVFANLEDVAVADSVTVTFQGTTAETANNACKTNQPIVGQTLVNDVVGVASSDPREIPDFDSVGQPVLKPGIDYAGTSSAATLVTAIEIEKSEPSPEAELLRGVHQQRTTYTLEIRNNGVGATTDLTVTDFLPAGLEFLGCGTQDNTTPDAAVEYTGAPRLGVPPLSIPDCPTPTSVETVLNPPAQGGQVYPPGVYTKVTWQIADLAPHATTVIKYVAGIPLQANEMFPASPTPPTPASTEQGSNLDNNTGSTTREGASESSLTNYARAAGIYQGANTTNPGQPVAVSDATDHTVTREDVRLLKSVSPKKFASAGPATVATFTLDIDVSEYVTAAGVVVTDVLPDGYCPLGGGSNYAPDLGTDCNPGGGAAPTGAAFDQVDFDAQTGAYTITFSPIAAISANGSAQITFTARMRDHYSATDRDGQSTVAGDSFTNTASLTATTTPIQCAGVSCTPESGAVEVLDASESEQNTDAPVLVKTMKPRTTTSGTVIMDPDCSVDSDYGDPADWVGTTAENTDRMKTFRKGDKLCFKIEVRYPATIDTRNSVVTDFLALGSEFIPGSEVALAGNDVTTSFTSPQGTPVWLVGSPSGGTPRFVPPGSIFSQAIAAVITDPAKPPLPDLTGNLAKFAFANTAGVVDSRRDMVDFLIAPGSNLDLLKGVYEVANPATLPGAGPNQADTDGSTVQQGAKVTYRIDLTNALRPDHPGADFSAHGIQAVDVLPEGVACPATPNYRYVPDYDPATEQTPLTGILALPAGFASCTPANPGSANILNPAFGDSQKQAVITWTFPNDDAYEVHEGNKSTLLYDVVMPAAITVSGRLDNNAGVATFTSETNQSGAANFTGYFPADNILAANEDDHWNAQAADDDSYVVTSAATVAKSGLTSIVENNNNEPTQATIGERVRYTYSVSVPAQTSVHNGSLTDTLPTGFTLQGAPAPELKFYPDASQPGTTTLPSGVTLTTASGAVAFGTTYTNATATAQKFEVVAWAVVTTSAATSTQNNVTRTNTARFTSDTKPTGGTAITPRTATYEIRVIQPSPSLAKSADPTSATGGQQVTYRLTASNASGRPPMHDTVVVDCLPNKMVFNSVSSPVGADVTTVAGTGSNGCAVGFLKITWNVGTVLAGSANSKVLTYTALVQASPSAGDTYTNTADLSTTTISGTDANERTFTRTANASVNVPGATGAKSVSPTRATIGETLTYTVAINMAKDTAAYSAAIVDVLPAGLDPDVTTVSVTCTYAGTIDPCVGIPPSGFGTLLPRVGQKVAWSFGDVPADPRNRLIVLTYTTTVLDLPGNAAGVTRTNSAQGKWNTTPGTVLVNAASTDALTKSTGVLQATATIIEPSMSVAKSVSNATPGLADTFTYTVEVTNSSGANVSPAHDVRIVDTIPTGVVVDPASISDGGSLTGAGPNGGGTITWNLTGPIPAGATQSLTYEASLADSSTLTDAGLTNTVDIAEYYSLPTESGRRYDNVTPAAATVTPEFPRFTTAKSVAGGDEALIGSPFGWIVTVTNTGPGAGFNVDVVDVLPLNWTYDAGSAHVSVAGGPPADIEPTIGESAGVQTLTWSDLGDLVPSARIVVTFTATPGTAVITSPGVGNTIDHTNTARATGDDADGNYANAAGNYSGGPDTAVAHISAADLAVAKALVDPAPPITQEVVAGTQFSWQITVTNEGPDESHAPITVTDVIPAGLEFVSATGTGWACAVAADTVTVSCVRASGILPAAASTPAISVTVGVPADTAAGTNFENVATVAGTTLDPNPDNNTDTDTVVTTASADVAVVKSTVTDQVVAGETISYTLEVSNNGPSTSRGPVTVTDVLPAGVSYVSATGSGWSCTAAGQDITCTHAADLLAQGEPTLITVTGTVAASTPPGSQLRNTATVTPTTPDPNQDNNSSEVTDPTIARADLAIIKSHPDEPAPVAGEPFTFELSITNNGPSDAAGPIVITDDVPDDMTFASGGGEGFTCTASPDANPGSIVTCTRAAGLASGATLAPTITFNIDPAAVLDTLTNTASVTSSTRDPNPGNNTSTDAIDPNALVDLVAHKSHANPLDPVLAGNQVTFDLTFDNLGPSVETGPFTIVDPLPVGMTWTGEGASDAGWVCTPLPASPQLPNGGVACTHMTATGLPVGTNVLPKLQLVFQVAADVSIIDTEIINAVTITGTSPEQDTGNNTDYDTVKVTNQADLVLVKKADPPTVTAGQDATFTIEVSNAGPSAAYLVQVTDTLPTGMTFKSASGSGWDCDGAGQQVVCTSTDTDHHILAPGDAESISVVATVAAGTADGSTLTNTATVETITYEESKQDNTDTADVLVAAEADLVLTKAQTNVNDPVYAGSTVTFTLDVVNNGPSDAQGPIEIIDTLPAGFSYLTASSPWLCTEGGPGSEQEITCTLGGVTSLAAGGSTPTLTMDVAIDPDSAPGEYDNTAVVSSQTSDPNPGNNEDEIAITVSALADLEVTKTHTGTAVIGTTIDFEVAVTNHGPSSAQGVQVVDTLPAGLTYVDASGTGWTCDNTGPDPQVVTCDLTGSLLGAADPITITVEVLASAYPSVSNGVAVTSTTPEPSPDPQPNTDVDTLVVDPLADLWITKAHSGNAEVGQQLTFQLTVGNDGPTSDPGPITVIDTLPTGLDFVSATGTGWSCDHDPASGQVRCELPAGDPALAAQDTSVITLLTTVTAAAYPQAENGANVDSPAADPNPENNTAVDPVTVEPKVDLTIAKSHTGDATVGSEVTFTLTVGNNGPTDDPGPITVTDTLPAGLELVSVSGSGWVCGSVAPVLCTRTDSLPVGVSAVITMVARVGAAAYPSANNTATVTSTAVDADPTNNSAIDQVGVAPLVDLWLTKTHTGQPAVGGSVAFTITVGNSGPTADPGPVVVTDTLPTGLAFSSASGVGWTCQAAGQVLTCTLPGGLGAGATSTITLSAAVGAGAYPSVTNTAAVTSSAVDTDPANNGASDPVGVTPVSNLTIAKELAALQDDSATWGITVTNRGPSATTTAVTVVDPLPAGLTFRSASGAGWTCSASGQVVTCIYPGSLAAGASARLEIVTAVAVSATVVSNTVYLGAVGGVSDSAVIEPSSCGSDGAGSDCGGFGPAVPLKVKALNASAKLVKGDRRRVVTSARTSNAQLATKVICRDAKGRKVSGCKITVGKANAVKLQVGRCKIRKATVTIKASPTAAGYRSKFWTRTWRVRACG